MDNRFRWRSSMHPLYDLQKMKSSIALLALLTIANVLMGNEHNTEIRKEEFTIDGVDYFISYTWEQRQQSKWNYLSSDLPPVTFKEAHEIISKEIKRAFPEEVFEITELDLNAGKTFGTYYRSSLTYMINGTGHSYMSINLYVYMDGRVSSIQKVDPVGI